MRVRFTERRERREPEKTPLIDVIFLLLIFFFVTVGGLDMTPKPTQGLRPGGAMQRQKLLLKMQNPLEPAPDSLENVLLLQVQLVDEFTQEVVKEFNEIIPRISRHLGNGLNPISSAEFVIFLFDEKYSNISELHQLAIEMRTKLRELDQNPNNAIIRNELSNLTLNYMPINLPARHYQMQFNEQVYEAAITKLTQTIGRFFPQAKTREIHCRLHRSVYSRFIEDLFAICNQVNIDLENIKIRVLDEKRA